MCISDIYISYIFFFLFSNVKMIRCPCIEETLMKFALPCYGTLKSLQRHFRTYTSYVYLEHVLNKRTRLLQGSSWWIVLALGSTLSKTLAFYAMMEISKSKNAMGGLIAVTQASEFTKVLTASHSWTLLQPRDQTMNESFHSESILYTMRAMNVF